MSIPHHFDKNYYEIRASLTLKHLFPLAFSQILHSEKPDLCVMHDEYGIEVTRMVDKDEQERMSYYKKYVEGRSCSEIDAAGMCKFEQNGIETIFCEDIAIGYVTSAKWGTLTLAFDTIDKKIKRAMSGNYNSVKSIGLYMFSDTFEHYDLTDVEKIVSYMNEKQKNITSKFSELFFDDCGWFYRCSLQDGKVEFFNTKPFLHDICEIAKWRAERGI